MSIPAHRRVAYLVSRYPAVSHTFILREVLALRSLGFQIDVASINSADACLSAQDKEEAGRTLYVKAAPKGRVILEVAGFTLRRPLRSLMALWFALRMAGAYGVFYYMEAVLLAGWMRRRRLRHLHVHFATPAATVGLILTHVARVTLSITVHGPDEFYDVTHYRLREKIAGSAFLCTIGRFASSQLMKLSPPDQWSKMEITPLGVDPGCFQPRVFRAAPPLFEILCVGRLVPAKGQHILLQAIQELRAGQRSVFLRLVGDGPDRSSLERQVAESGLSACVKFEGTVDQDHIQSFYSTADVFALASFAEGIPVVLMEAMAMTVPCVSSRITGIPELIRDGIDGLLVTPADAAELASAIGRLMDDADLRRRLGEAGRQRVIAKYNLSHNTQQLAEVFDRRLRSTSCG